MTNFKFFDKFPHEQNFNSKLIVIPKGIKNRFDLIQFFMDKLDFPDYSNTNWDSFYENFTNLDWIENFNIQIIHEEIPPLDEKDRKIYLKLLEKGATYWTHDKSHNVEILFPINLKVELEKGNESKNP
ncbi:barstar family protein [Parachlamydia acanthamoebae]|uniref:barstar family protein n=1 Tax=Parachlamydia acanthamoebae TaxID=83552 RepID=UPI0007511FBE|nr:barstar family protein [Parachlamydia acanthamoebae]